MNPAALSQTIAACPLDTSAVVDRLSTLLRLKSALPEETKGPALIYEVPGTQEVRALPLHADETIVGRIPLSDNAPDGCHLAFPDSKKLSSRHFRVRREGEEFVLEDLDSKNGTYVNTNTKPIKKKTLVAADEIYAGGVVFVFDNDQP